MRQSSGTAHVPAISHAALLVQRLPQQGKQRVDSEKRIWSVSKFLIHECSTILVLCYGVSRSAPRGTELNYCVFFHDSAFS